MLSKPYKISVLYKCPRCNKDFLKKNNRQKYCGSSLEKGSCSYIMRALKVREKYRKPFFEEPEKISFEEKFITQQECERIRTLNVWKMRFHIKDCQDCKNPFVQENKEQKVCRLCINKIFHV